MPDENDGPLDELEQLAEDSLLVDALMGWDGDRCECPDCACERLQNGTDGTVCAACLTRDHWRADD